MTRYLASRFVQAVLTLFIVMLIVFLASRMTGDPAELMLPPTATDAEIRQMQQVLGTDRHVLVQFGTFVKRAGVGDMGESIRHRRPVTELIMARLPNSVKLAAAAMFFTIVMAFGLGIAAAYWSNSPLDLGVRLLGVLGLSLPGFWIAILLMNIFAVRWGLLPASGTSGLASYVLPVVVIGSHAIAGMMRLLRSQLIEVLGSDYIRTAHAKGSGPSTVVLRHALRNSVIPVLTVAGLYFANILGGSVIAETVFVWPGIGQLAYQSVVSRDFPLMQGVVLLSAGIVVAMNLAVDLLYGVVDPRIRVTST